MEVRAAPPLRYTDVRHAYSEGAGAVLDGVSFEVARGEGVALFGANGAGKTTLLRLAMGLAKGASGTVELGGIRSGESDPEDLAAMAGYLFQQPESQLFERTVEREIGFGPRCLGWDAGRVAAAVGESLEAVGLGGLAGEHPYDLPAPHRRLVALAAVIASDPPLLLLDEPTAGLDRDSRAIVRRVVLARRAAGAAVLAVTHDGDFALEALDRGLVLERGRIVSQGPITGLLGRRGAPPLPPTARLAARLGLHAPVPRFDALVHALAATLPHPSAEH